MRGTAVVVTVSPLQIPSAWPPLIGDPTDRFKIITDYQYIFLFKLAGLFSGPLDSLFIVFTKIAILLMEIIIFDLFNVLVAWKGDQRPDQPDQQLPI